MKAFFTSIFLAFTSLFGVGQKLPAVQIEPTPTIIQSPSVIPTETIDQITPTIKPTVSLKPTIIKPKSFINAEILKIFFGISDANSANQILNDDNQLKKYESEYYQKYKTLPIPRLNIDPKKQYAMPNKNGMVICSAIQLKSLYDEITKTENDSYRERMDQDCHSDGKTSWPGRKYKPESTECQNWRRDNDQNRVVPTKGSLDEEIQKYTEKLNYLSNLYDTLITKYCK